MTELSNTQAGGIIGRIGVSSPADPGPLRVLGVSRDCGSPAILVAFNRMPSDDELRDLHNVLTLVYAGLPAVVREAGVIPMRDGLPALDPRTAWPLPGQVDRALPARRAPTTCGECSYEEADGELIEQCAKCKAVDANPCKLTECQGRPRCATCIVMDSRYGRPQAADSEGGEPT